MRPLILALLLFSPQDKVESYKVDKAVDAGAKYLLKVMEGRLPAQPHSQHEGLTKRELMLYALAYAGINESNAAFRNTLNQLLADRIKSTYGASVQAMLLEALDRVKYQERIGQCAQFLIDNQCKNGQWFYGTEVELAAWKPRDTGSGTSSLKKISIKRRKMVGEETGDNSNTQYAVLGLRACLMAGIEVPKETLADAEKWWLGAQNKDGGWDYDCFETRGEHSYGGMTAGAIGSIAILKYHQKKDWKKDPSIQKGVDWIAENFSVNEHPKFDWDQPSSKWRYYWLYALERAGMLLELEKFGAHDWYQEGARHLVDAQRRDGSWVDNEQGDPENATCFAILFLRRATKRLQPVPTGK